MTHKHQVDYRVYYEDTDAGGIVYHANYLRFAERARTEWLRDLGFNQSDLRKQNVLFVVRHITVDYKKPAMLDDVLNVVTTLDKIAGSSMVLTQNVMKNDEVAAHLSVAIVCINLEWKPVRIPDSIRKKLDK
ncbi:MAG: tol-pal system-associated acyl-CoA thioesterase [Proteobacteria bacterium]|nr:tol-pal system-associated acyl-CoA thioesterase [Pseudomonadota bacterium]